MMQATRETLKEKVILCRTQEEGVKAIALLKLFGMSFAGDISAFYGDRPFKIFVHGREYLTHSNMEYTPASTTASARFPEVQLVERVEYDIVPVTENEIVHKGRTYRLVET